MTEQTSVEVPTTMIAKLEALAERTGQSADDHLIAAIDAHVSQAGTIDDLEPPAFEEMVADRIQCGESQLYEIDRTSPEI